MKNKGPYPVGCSYGPHKPISTLFLLGHNSDLREWWDTVDTKYLSIPNKEPTPNKKPIAHQSH